MNRSIDDSETKKRYILKNEWGLNPGAETTHQRQYYSTLYLDVYFIHE